MTMESINTCATKRPDTESNPNATTKRQEAVSIQLNSVACPMYPERNSYTVFYYFPSSLSLCREHN